MRSRIFISIILFFINTLAFGEPIKVGVVNFWPPFSTTAGSGHHYGFVIDLMDEICRRINIQCVYKETSVKQQFQALTQEIIDISLTQAPIPSNMLRDFVYSLPYLSTNGQFVTLKGSNINTIDQLITCKIGALEDTLYPLITNSPFAKNNTIKKYASFNEMVLALQAKKIDVIYISANTANFAVNNSLLHLKFIGKTMNMGEGYGILALRKNETLIKEINNALIDMKTDGTYLKIYKQYFD